MWVCMNNLKIDIKGWLVNRLCRLQTFWQKMIINQNMYNKTARADPPSKRPLIIIIIVYLAATNKQQQFP